MTVQERIDQILSGPEWPDVLPASVVESTGRILLVAEVGEAS